MFKSMSAVILDEARCRLELALANVSTIMDRHPMNEDSMRDLNEIREDVAALREFIQEFRKGDCGTYDHCLVEDLLWSRLEREESCSKDDIY